MSCDRRSAQAIPAGPPPTMTTSASICGRSIPSIGRRKWIMALAWKPASGPRLLDFFGQRRDHIEQVTHHPVIRNLEDGCFHVLIDGHDGPRALHAHNMLDRAADAERNIQLGRNRLPGTAD